MSQEKHATLLPENAYRPLQSGETYKPIIPATEKIAEISMRSIIFGLLLAIIFSGASAFLGLKIGQVFEAAIPIAILAVGISRIFPRKSTILENVIIQSIGSASGAVVAGIIFTLPAIFILHLNISFFEIFTAAFLGGSLGILFLILFRKYFVRDMHGKLPFPEATATNEILVTGDAGGNQARVLVTSILIGAIYDFSVYTLHWLNELFSTNLTQIGHGIAQKTKLIFEMNVTAAVMGMGYIIGLRFAAIICAGSFLSWYVFVPIVAHFSFHNQVMAQMDVYTIFNNYVRLIGIGAITAAGIIGILKASSIIKDALILAIKEITLAFRGKRADKLESKLRTNKDIRMEYIFIALIIVIITSLLFFKYFPLHHLLSPWKITFIAIGIVTLVAFLFTPVAARAIAIVGTNPLSGLTLMTLILSSIVLEKIGLKGNQGIIAALIIGGVVSTALAMAGSFVTDLKIGYWIGATPRNQERFKFLGTLVSAATVGMVILLLNQTYGFIPDAAHPEALIAPQANAMAAVISTIMTHQKIHWILYGTGIVVAIVCEMCKIPPLAFALGMYLPLELNTPLLLGAFVAYFVKKSARSKEIANHNKEKGTLIASGFIAGGAITGVISAMLKYFGADQTLVLKDLINLGNLNYNKNIISLIACLSLALFFYCYTIISKQRKKQ